MRGRSPGGTVEGAAVPAGGFSATFASLPMAGLMAMATEPVGSAVSAGPF